MRLKCDFHTHTASDPVDTIPHGDRELVEKAAELGFGFLAITPHRKVHPNREVIELAQSLGITMVPSAELRVCGKDVLVIGVEPNDPGEFHSWDEFKAYRKTRPNSLCIAPHPFFIIGASLGRLLEKHIECFDAIEICHFHTPGFDLNKRARAVAKRHNKPLVGTSDAHTLKSFGNHHSLVECEDRSWNSIRQAILAGKVEVVSPPTKPLRFLITTKRLLAYYIMERLFKKKTPTGSTA